MNRQKKNQAGITLIALVISIIVMLVLAGVSLNATVGENGIVTKAQEAKSLQEVTTLKEQLEMSKVDMQISNNSFDEYWFETEDVSGMPGLENIPDYLKDKLEIQEGNLVYNPEKCSESDIEYFKNSGIPEGNFVLQGIQVDIQGAEDAKDLVGPNICILLDLSGSMDTDNPTRLTNAKPAIKNIINNSFLEDETSKTLLSLVTFNNNGNITIKNANGKNVRNGAGVLEFGAGKRFVSNYQEAQVLNQEVDSLQTVSGAGFGTKVTNGLNKAKASIDEMQAVYDENIKFLILIADGEADDRADAIAKAKKLRDDGIIIYTIGYAVTKNSATYNTLKEITGDEDKTIVASASGTEEILAALENIKRKIDNVTAGVNTNRGILTIQIQEGCKIDNREPITVKILNETFTYTLDTLPSNMSYNEEEGIFKWNIRQYTKDQQENLDIDFKIIQK